MPDLRTYWDVAAVSLRVVRSAVLVSPNGISVDDVWPLLACVGSVDARRSREMACLSDEWSVHGTAGCRT